VTAVAAPVTRTPPAAGVSVAASYGLRRVEPADLITEVSS
jgi:hypothetical protein